MYVVAKPRKVKPGGNAKFIISTVHGPVTAPLTVSYTMAGSATFDSDYTLSGTFGEATIRAGASSTRVVLHALRGAGKKATMILTRGPGYFVSDVAGQDTVKIRKRKR